MVRSILLYSLEFWLFLKMKVQRLMAENIRIIRWICGDISLDRIKKGVVRERVRNTNTDKRREARLMWFCYIRKGVDMVVGGLTLWNVTGVQRPT